MSNEWNPADKFPPVRGMYEVRGMAVGKRFCYFDGWHWHLHDESAAPDLNLRSHGCPGSRWRFVASERRAISFGQLPVGDSNVPN